MGWPQGPLARCKEWKQQQAGIRELRNLNRICGILEALTATHRKTVTMWKYLWLVTNKVRLLGHELRDEFKSVSDGSNCYHILTD